MIKKLNIRWFKSIEAAELELGHVNVFIGANGSGKSNLLEALAVLAAAAYGRVDQESLIRRGCRSGGILRPMFHSTPGDASILLEATTGNERYLVELFKPPERGATTQEFKQELLQSSGRTIVERPAIFPGDPGVGFAALKLAETPIDDPAAAFLKELSAFSIYTPDTPILRGLQQDPQVREPVGLSGGELSEAVAELLLDPPSTKLIKEELRLSIEWFEDLLLLDGVNRVKRVRGGTRNLFFIDRFFRKNQSSPSLLRVDEINEGALYLLFLSVVCLHPGAPKFFAIDNADHGLNPRLARRLMSTMCRWLLERNRQMLMSTQNPLVLDGLPLQDERVRLFTVDRDNTGKTQVRRFLLTPQHHKMAGEGWTLSRMWVNGLIGGVPDV